MMSFLLLILSLNTGFVALVDVQGCTGGWVEFTCKYPKENVRKVEVETPRGDIKQIKQNEWKEDNGRFLFHNTAEKHLRMIVKPLEKKDFGKYECEFNGKEVEFELKNRSVCLKDLVQTTHRTAQTTIDCSHQGFNFICKENRFTCDIILRKTSPVKTFNNVSQQDAGVYWCGTESQSYKVSRQKIHLDVKVASSTVSTISSTAQDTVTTASVYNTVYSTEKTILVASSTVSTISSTAWDTVTTASVYNTVPSTETTRKQDELWKTLVIVTVVFVLLLLTVFFSYKRFNCFNNTTEKKIQEHFYEEIDERPQLPGSGTTLKTIYTTVTLPSEPPPEPLYITLDHPTSAQTRSTEINPSSSSSDETFTKNVLYSTMNTPQQTASS